MKRVYLVIALLALAANLNFSETACVQTDKTAPRAQPQSVEQNLTGESNRFTHCVKTARSNASTWLPAK
jgi:hypothetical protein